MLLDLPDVSVTLGPEWAQKLNDALEAIDNHDHTSDNGKQVPISGVDVNQNLDMQQLEVVDTKAVNFQNLGSVLSGAPNVNKFHVVSGNVWFTNAGGTPVQITDGNAIVSNVIIPPSPLMPSGTVLDYAGAVAPVGFLACDGAAISRTTYSDLFAAIGTIWGSGDGSTTFNIPNFNGRTSIGNGNYTDPVSGSITRSVAQSIGAEAHVLTTPQIPSHTHTQNAHSHAVQSANGPTAISLNNPGNAGILAEDAPAGGYVSTAPVGGNKYIQDTVATNQNTGGGLSHNNMQPSLVVLKMIKT